jgi:crossover junction endodeoxyribonuclease RuvC
VPNAKRTILGIDPGSRFTGFGVVRVEGDKVLHLSHGVIAPPSQMEFCQRIGVLAAEIEALVARIEPSVTVIERVFLGKNADSAFKLGHARGVAVAAAARAGSEIVEYATRAVKKGITGTGAASKEQVQAVLFAVLGLKGRMQMDASDALALAVFHARTIEVQGRLARQGREVRP